MPHYEFQPHRQSKKNVVTFRNDDHALGSFFTGICSMSSGIADDTGESTDCVISLDCVMSKLSRSRRWVKSFVRRRKDSKDVGVVRYNPQNEMDTFIPMHNRVPKCEGVDIRSSEQDKIGNMFFGRHMYKKAAKKSAARWYGTIMSKIAPSRCDFLSNTPCNVMLA